MVEGNALVQSGLRPVTVHVCQRCVEACHGLFQQHTRAEPTIEDLPTPGPWSRTWMITSLVRSA